MILDSEEQKALLLQIFNAVNIPASQIEKLYELKKNIERAETNDKTAQKESCCLV